MTTELGTSNDINDVKKCLKDAGLYEDNMDTKVMMLYYDAIKNSENTANKEDEVRKSKTSSKENNTSKVLEEEESLQLEESGDEIDVSTSQDIITNFCDMPPLSEKLLDVVYHEPKYFLAVNYNSDSYNKLNLRQKVSLLYKYHTNLSSKMAALARKSLHLAPRCKDIQSSNKFNGSLLKSTPSVNDDTFDFVDGSSLYTSRSGRQVKRKVYAEDIEDEDIFKNKKTKNKDEEEWHAKKAKTLEKKSNTPDNLKPLAIKEVSENKSLVVSSTPKVENENVPTPTAKRTSLKKLSNEEIMKRSSLFSPVTTKRTRAEAIQDKMKEEEAKKKQAEKEMELFEKTLPDTELDSELSDFLNFVDSPVKESEAEPAPRKRLVGRRSINTRKRVTEEETSTADPKSARRPLRNVSKPNSSVDHTREVQEADSSTSVNGLFSTKSNAKMVDCPLCNIAFPEEEIQEHAATCCESSDIATPSLRSSRRLTCEICDKTLLFDTNYELHVKQCMKAQNKKISA